ncbi:MAG TPA: ABC transporter permease [Thermoanaerobaculia bacterium]|nr:ABC transporter permease [Thermoanaerobaculia bacterium]
MSERASAARSAAATGREASGDAGPRAVAVRGRGFEPRLRPAVAWLALAALLALWQAGSAAGLIGELTLPSPARIARSLGELATGGDLWGHLAASAGRIAGGFLLGFSTGVVAGLLIGIFTLSRSIGVPVVAALFPIPKIALLPLFILWFGIGEWSKVATIAFGVFFPTAVATYGAVDAVPRNLVRMGQSFGLAPAAITAKILLPGALPGILSGARIASSIALILVVAAEMIGAERGIGALILTSGHLMQTDRLLAGVVVLSVLGLVVAWAIGALERRLLRWR